MVEPAFHAVMSGGSKLCGGQHRCSLLLHTALKILRSVHEKPFGVPLSGNILPLVNQPRKIPLSNYRPPFELRRACNLANSFQNSWDEVWKLAEGIYRAHGLRQ